MLQMVEEISVFILQKNKIALGQELILYFNYGNVFFVAKQSSKFSLINFLQMRG